MASVRQVSSVVLSVFLPLFASSAQAEQRKPATSIQKGSHWTLPLSFERNEGQMPAEVGFLGRTQRYSVAVGRRDLRFSLPGSHGTTPVVLSLEGSEAAAPRGITQAPFLTNEYLGSDVSKYRTGIRNYSRIGLSHVYPGVDAEFYASGDEIEHDFIVAPGANAGAIAMRVSSRSTATLTREGEVLVPAGEGELRLKKPVAYQIAADGRHTEVAAGFVLDAIQNSGQSGGQHSGQTLHFQLGDYDHTRTLVIDPVIVYATVAAGAAGSTATSIATDPSDNVYVSGITTSTAFNPSPATAPVVNCGTAPCANNLFIASLAKGSNGTTLQWITYIGAADAGSVTTPTSLLASSAAIYVGGSTNDSALAAGLTATAPNPTSGASGSVGYISALTPATGALNSTTLVYADAVNPNNSSVQALALDAGGNLYAAGAIGTQVTDPAQLVINPTANALTLSVAATTFVANQQGQPGNAYVMQLPAAGPFGDPTTHVATPAFFTYVQGNTQINGVAVDAAGLIYVGGQTQGDFGAPLVAAPVPNLAAGKNDAFLATFAITPLASGTASVVTAFTPVAGTGDDQVAGLTIDGAGNSYLFGPTSSADLPTTAGVIQATPPNAGISGYVALIPAAGSTPTALTYLGSSGGDSILSGAFGGGNLYVAGQTSAPATTGAGAIAFGGVPSTTASGTAPFNTQALALGMDTTTAGLQHGYLASVNGALTAVNYVANIGGSLAGDVATGVALDSKLNAYVSGTTGAGSAPYTSYSAYQALTPATSGSSGYVAEIAYAATTAGLTLAPPATGSPSVDPIGYGSASTASTVNYTWTLNAASATAPANLVLQIPSQVALTYNSVTITDVTDTTQTAITCPVLPPGGVSCVIPAIAQQVAGTNDTLSIVLAATVTSLAPTTGTLTITASVSGPAADYVSSSQTSNLAMAANLSITPATTFPASTVFSTNTAATGPNTQAVYVFTVANAAGAGEAKTTVFTLATPPTGFQIGTVTAVVAGGAVATTCDTTSAATGCQSLDLPAGASLTYTLTGTYPDSVVDATGSTAAAGAFTASLSGSQSNINAIISPNTTVQRGVHLKLAGVLSALPNSQTAFNLADPLTYSITMTNSGPSASSGADALAVTLPSAFVATGVTGITCAAPYTTCTIPAIAAGASITYVISGSFPDTNVNSAIAATAQAEAFSATATLHNSFESGSPASDYSTTVNTTVQRTAVLTVTTSSIIPPATTCGGGGTNCLYMQNATDTKDKAAYNFVVQNAGPNTAVNANVTLTFPFAPMNPAGTAHPLNPGTPVSSPAAPTFGTPLTCTVQAATNQIVCSGGNLPVNATALKVSGNATVDAGTVPAASQFVTTTSSRGSVAVTEDANGAPANTTLTPVEVDRAAHLVTVKSVAAGPGASAAFPLYLSNNSNTNDIVTVTIKVGNSGPNDATNVVVTDQLPAYFVLTQAPTGCSVGGTVVTTAYPPQPAQVTMTCTLGTVAAGDATPSSGGTPASAGTTATTITYAGKFQDNGLNPDITGTQPNKVSHLTVNLGSAVASTTAAIDALGASDATSAVSSFVVERAAHLVTVKTATPASGTTASFPIYLNNAAGTNNLVTVTTQVGNSGPNDALAVVVTDTLPAYFVFTQAPTGCTVGGVAVTTAYPPQTSPVTMTCALNIVTAGTAIPSNPGPISVGTSFQSITYTGGFQDNGASPDITGLTASKKASLSVPFGAAAAATALAVDPLSFSDATSTQLSVDVQRASHLILRKTRNGTVASAPSSFTDTTDPNLDEKTTATAFGVNDEVEYAIALGNAGVNQALGVQFTETLPPFFTVTKMYAINGASVTPDTGANAVPGGQLAAGSLVCSAGTAVGTPITLPYATTGASQQITCGYGTATSPIALPAGASKTGIPDNATSIEFVYQGKFQDNAPGVDTIPAGTSTFAVASAAGEARGSLTLAKDNGPLTDSASLAIASYAIQRAAHLTLIGIPKQVDFSDNGLSIIGQAEPSSIAGAGPVINCLRYKVLIQNSGPNIARQPQLTLAPPPGLNLTDSPSAFSTTPGTDAPLPGVCSTTASTSPTILGTATVPVSQKAGNTLVIDIDGYFGLETLTNNSTTGYKPTFASLLDKGVMESVKGSAFAPVTGDPVTLVNTPVGSSFYVSPFQTSGTVRPARIAFSAVTAPGATTLAVSKTGPLLPSGPSPDPRANKQVIPLYRTGTTANFYALASSASVTAGIQPTQICLTSGAGGALPDLFAKPERVLLWALSGLPSGTGLNAVPNVTAPYLGDVTSAVLPLSGTSYFAPGGPAMPYTTYAALPGTQSQPQQVCGQVNGFAPAATPVTVAVLEPVNFAPYIAANSQQSTAPPGKGVSEVSFLFPTAIHDYNDNDPCYVSASTTGTPGRGTCDDNLLLTTWVFGGESLLPSLNHVVGPLSPTAASAFVNAPAPYEVQAGATLFIQVADQLSIPAYKAAGNCDPGNAPGTYQPNTANACPLDTTKLTGTPPQETIFGSADIALLNPSAGGGSSGLIILPPAANATVLTTPVATGYVAAAATVTAGQTVGFQWKLGDIVPAAGGTYNLACFLVDAATQNTQTTMPAGLSCQIPLSITFPPNFTVATAPANPAIFVVTSGSLTVGAAAPSTPGWRGALGGVVAALLLPLLLLRRRSADKLRFGLVVLLLLLGGAVGLSGCGSGQGTGRAPVVAPSQYFFRAMATPSTGGGVLITAPFSVTVAAGN